MIKIMAQKSAIARIRILYSITLVVVAVCVGLFIFNVVASADPLAVPTFGDQTDGVGVVITDLRSSSDLYLQSHAVDGMPEGLSAVANVKSYDVSIMSANEEALDIGRVRWCMWLQVFSALGILAMAVLFIMALISLYINVRRGKVFPKKNITWLVWAGALMIAVSLSMDVSTYLERSLAVELMHGSTWQPAPMVTIHFTRIFFGLTIIFLAEIFKIGRAMQEEQELTI